MRGKKKQVGTFLHDIEGFLGCAIPADTKKKLEKSEPLKYALKRAQVEHFCDFLSARVGQGLQLFVESSGAEALHAAVVIAQNNGTLLDLRLVSNPSLVSSAFKLYLSLSEEPLFPLFAYVRFSDFFSKTTAVEESVEEIAKIVRELSAESRSMMQRVCLLCSVLPEGIKQLSECLLRPPEVADRGASFEESMKPHKIRFIGVCVVHITRIFPDPYVAVCAKSQNSSFNLPPLTESDWMILLHGAEVVNVKAGTIFIDEGARNTKWLYRVRSGTFDVYVGAEFVAELTVYDLMGDQSLLGNYTTRASVKAAVDSSVWKIDFEKLELALTLRPDLGKRFWLLMGQQLSMRLNASATTSAAGKKDVDIRPSRPASAPTNAEVPGHGAILAFKPGGKRAKKQDCLYLFTDALLYVRSKWGREQEIEMTWDNVQRMIEVPGTTCDVDFDGYTENKKGESVKTSFVFTFVDEQAKKECLDACNHLRGTFAAEKKPSLISRGDSRALATQAIAILPFLPSQSFEIALTPGDEIVVLEKKCQTEGWYYGFNTRNPVVRGMIPSSHVELLPLGSELPHMPTKEDWNNLMKHTETIEVPRGTVIAREGDPLAMGNLIISTDNYLVIMRGEDKVGSVFKNEVLGEISFLIGGAPRASVVFPLHAPVPKTRYMIMRRNKLEQLLLQDDALATRFLKLLACLVTRRLARLQHAPSDSGVVPSQEPGRLDI